MNKLLPLLLACLLLFQNEYSTAAIPIRSAKAKQLKEQNSSALPIVNSNTEKKLNKVNTLSKIIPKPDGIAHSNDFGLFGILALATGILGLFPAAIVFGLIGKQPGRKLQGIAYLGFTLGLVVGILAILVFLFFVFVLAYVF